MRTLIGRSFLGGFVIARDNGSTEQSMLREGAKETLVHELPAMPHLLTLWCEMQDAAPRENYG